MERGWGSAGGVKAAPGVSCARHREPNLWGKGSWATPARDNARRGSPVGTLAVHRAQGMQPQGMGTSVWDMCPQQAAPPHAQHSPTPLHPRRIHSEMPQAPPRGCTGDPEAQSTRRRCPPPLSTPPHAVPYFPSLLPQPRANKLHLAGGRHPAPAARGSKSIPGTSPRSWGGGRSATCTSLPWGLGATRAWGQPCPTSQHRPPSVGLPTLPPKTPLTSWSSPR